MSMFFHGEPVEFTPMPECPEDQLPQVLRTIGEGFGYQYGSYGGFVLRQASPDALAQAVDFMHGLYPTDFRFTKVAFGKGSEAKKNRQEIGVHDDLDEGLGGDLTVHQTEAGIGEVVVLRGSSFLVPAVTRAIGRKWGNALLDERRLPRTLKRPQQALYAQLGATDMVLLNPSHPHVFRGDSSRMSSSYFMEPPHLPYSGALPAKKPGADPAR